MPIAIDRRNKNGTGELRVELSRRHLPVQALADGTFTVTDLSGEDVIRSCR